MSEAKLEGVEGVDVEADVVLKLDDRESSD
jgi:hypothetical protein